MRSERAWWKVESERVGKGRRRLERSVAEAIDLIRMFSFSYLSGLLQTQFYTNT